MKGNKAQNGLIYSIQGAYGKFQNLTIESNEAVYGSVIYSDNSNFSINSTLIFNNTSFEKGTLYALSSSKLDIYDSEFSNNTAIVEASIIFANNNPDLNISFYNCSFHHNQAGSNSLTMIQSHLIFTKCNFYENFAQRENHGATLFNSRFHAHDTNITCKLDGYNLEDRTSIDSGFFKLIYQSELILN